MIGGITDCQLSLFDLFGSMFLLLLLDLFVPLMKMGEAIPIENLEFLNKSSFLPLTRLVI